MSFSTFIALRYFAGRKKMFASLLTAIAILGVALGVFSLIVVLSVMGGFSGDLQKKLIGFNAHVIVEIPPGPPLQRGEEELNSPPLKKGGQGGFADKRIKGAALVVEGEGIIEVPSAGDNSAQGVKIRGIDNEDLEMLEGADIMLPGDLKNGVAILGSELAMQLNVHPDYGDKVQVVVPFGRVGPTGDILPEKMDLSVGGMFKTGYFDYDSKTVILTVGDAKRLLGDNARSATHIWLFDPRDARAVAARLMKEYPELKVSTWEGANKKLFAALKLERMAMSVLLTLIVVIACISIVSIIFMFVFARRKDIAVLEAIGVTKNGLRGIFIKIGAFIGVCGTFVGLAAGLALCLYLKRHPIMLPSSYYLDHLPVVISVPLVFLVAVGGVVLAALAAYYPARCASGTDARVELRYE